MSRAGRNLDGSVLGFAIRLFVLGLSIPIIVMIRSEYSHPSDHTIPTITPPLSAGSQEPFRVLRTTNGCLECLPASMKNNERELRLYVNVYATETANT